jgi:hypothetical protein
MQTLRSFKAIRQIENLFAFCDGFNVAITISGTVAPCYVQENLALFRLRWSVCSMTSMLCVGLH